MKILHQQLQNRGEHPNRQPYGFLVHNTGDGVCKKANKHNDSPLAYADRWYRKVDSIDPGRGPTAAIGPTGVVIQYRDPTQRTQHVRTTSGERRKFLSGEWAQDPRAPIHWDDIVSDWQDRYPDHRSPAHLYPSVNPSDDYVGVELTPCGTWIRGRWTWLWGTKPHRNARFSVEQYTALASLLAAYSVQTGLSGGWFEAGSGRLVGHEDVNPYSRPGWDPGAIRGWFRWDTLRGMLGVLL